MIKKKIGLIPRYNWDYDFSDLIKASVAAFMPASENKGNFEKFFRQNPVFTTSGRSALYVILKSLHLSEGSHVGVPLFCCSVVFDAIRQANLVPKFIDINLEDYNLSTTDLEKKKDSLSAIVIVHMFGHPADMDSISTISGDIPLVEDCAQSLFSTYKGQYTGFLSTASFFSFRSGKYISAGEGSAILAKDPILGNAIKKSVEAFDGWSFFQELLHPTMTYIKSTLYKRPWYGTLGYPIGMRIDRKLNLTAKTGFNLKRIARSDLRILDDRIENFYEKVKRQKENTLYLLSNIKMVNAFLPYEKDQCWSNYYQFAIRFQDTEKRNLMAQYLFDHGI
ncbi:DegT/DnrJ/EryC1/StrS family aminotransferase, partial [bacterium]|nr:DegT/DnrJ/EryC1/StrS family aminotransferase [bacterium]